MKINKKDLKIEYTRGSGPGGQHKNKVESCVTLKHIPTGLSERCQDSRSKVRNYHLALERLEQKIERENVKKDNQIKKDLRREKIRTNKRIRTYNYLTKKVIDHRTKKMVDLERVMKGELHLLR